jgi:hypothetical protein
MRDGTALDRAAQSADPRNDYARRFPALARLLLDHGAQVSISAAVALGDAEPLPRCTLPRRGAVWMVSAGLDSLPCSSTAEPGSICATIC